MHRLLSIALALASLIAFSSGQSASLEDSIAALSAVGPEGAGHAEAAAAWQVLSSGDAETILPMLAAIGEHDDPLQRNWLRSALETVYSRIADTSAAALPLAEMQNFISDTANPAAPRELAFDLLQRSQADLAFKLIPSFLSDPSPTLRRIAVQQLIDQAKASLAEDKEAAGQTFRRALDSARDAEQITTIAKHLRSDIGDTVDLPTQFGFLMCWHIIGPFDNTGREGFDSVFPPEEQIDLEASYPGKLADGKTVSWTEYATSDDYGMVDFNSPFSPLKEAVAYAYTEFQSDGEQVAQLRLGCKNAWKVWFNGELLFGRDEYHRGIRIDQYQLPVTIKPGRNTILIKACQCEQEKDWTKQWQFQLRVCDQTGTAILSTDRQPTPQKAAATRRPSA